MVTQLVRDQIKIKFCVPLGKCSFCYNFHHHLTLHPPDINITMPTNKNIFSHSDTNYVSVLSEATSTLAVLKTLKYEVGIFAILIKCKKHSLILGKLPESVRLSYWLPIN